MASELPPPQLPSLPSLSSLPSTSALLVQGGDHRIEIQPGSQINKYGCQPFPAADRIAFGSSTASQILPLAFDAANQLRDRIAAALIDPTQSAAAIYREELGRLRAEFLHLCGFTEASSPDMIFAASGTDAHLLAAHLAAALAQQARRSLRVIMVNPEESGSGVTAALNGRSLDSADAPGNEVVHVSIRQQLPKFGPGRWEAIADCDNLLAQGYVTMNTKDGQVALVPAFRTFRGGLSLQF